MTEAEARKCAQQIRHHLESARKLVLELCEREGWRALGYGSWAECVTAEFDQSRRYLYRQLDAARIEREVAPAVEIGTIPERQLRPLAAVPTGGRKAVWEAALAATPPGKSPTPQVERLAARITPARPPAVLPPADPDFLAAIEPEPADIAAQRRAGIIPEGVAVEVYDPFAFDPDAEPGDGDDGAGDMEGEQTDAEFLAACPARMQISGRCRDDFDRDALLYKALTPARDRFRHAAARHLAANRRRGRTGHFHGTVSWFLRANHPRHWTACGDCKGTGRHDLLGECTTCKAMGYQARG
jgi:hypothetical protein